VPPQKAVSGHVCAEREQARHERAEAEYRCERARAEACVGTTQAHEAGQRGERHEPAEVDEALELARVARDEVPERGRVALDLRDGALDGVAEVPDFDVPLAAARALRG